MRRTVPSREIPPHIRTTLIVVAVSLSMLGLFLMNRHNYHTRYWEGPGEVNLFPATAEVKNYRVKAYMRIDMEPRGFYGEKKTYKVDYVFWPNGGKTYFAECEVVPVEHKFGCTDEGLKEWKVEIEKEPSID